MSFENRPSATASFTSLDFAPLPARTYDLATAELANWSTTNLQKSQDNIGSRVGVQFYSGMYPSAGGYAQRTVTGLKPGRTYTFSMKYHSESGFTNVRGIWTLSVVGLGAGNPIDLKGATSDLETSYTFTATSTSHVLRLTLNAHSAGETSSAFRAVGFGLRGQPLPISEGSVILDKGVAPYAQSSVTVPLVEEDLLEQLNPFADQRVKITAEASGTWTTTPPVYSAWVTQAVNLAKSPRVAAGSATAPTGYTADGTVLTVARVDGSAFGVPSAARWTRGTTAAGSYRMSAGSTNSAFEVGKTYTVMVSILSSVDKVYSMYMRPNVASSTNQIAMPSINAEAGVVHNIRRTFVATGTSYGLTLTASGAVGDTLDATKVAYIEGEYTGPWFDGATENVELEQFTWSGTANASSSTYQTRTVVTPSTPIYVPDPPRVFDLVMRERVVNHADRTVTLDLATDEALLLRYSKLVDDLGAFDRQASLRSIVNYVLNEVSPGAALQTTGAPDLPFPVLADGDNMVTNPGAEGLAGFSAVGSQMLNENTWKPNNRKGVHIHSATTTDSYVAIGGDGNSMAYGMSTGRTYTFSASGSVRSTIGGASAPDPDYGTGTNMPRSRAIVVHTNGPTTGYRIWHSPQVPNVANSEARVSVQFTIPDDATMVFVRLYHGGTSGSISWSNFRLTETDFRPGVDNTVYFDGAMPANTEYAHSWTGAANASTSRRVALVDRAPELLKWDAGTTAWRFLETFLVVAKRKLYCDEQRRWWLIDPTEFQVAGRINVRTDNATQGTDTMDASSLDAPTGVIARFRWTDYAGESRSKDDIAGLPGRVRIVEFDRPYPGPGTAAAIMRRLTGQGRTQEVTVQSDVQATPGQEISISLPGTADQLGRLQSVRWRLTEGLMELESNGLTEVTPGSWLAENPALVWSAVPDARTWANS